jgi:hypothetical protein
MNLWHRLVQRIRQWAARVRSAVAGASSSVRAAGSRVRHAAGAATQRHRERADEDTAYARAISTAVSELVATMVPRPSLATTIAVALAGILGHPPQAHEQYRSRARDPYREYGTGNSAQPPVVPGSLWDRLQ